MEAIEYIGIFVRNYEVGFSEGNHIPSFGIWLPQKVSSMDDKSAIRFVLSSDRNSLYIYNAGPVIKIFSASGKLLLIQTGNKDGVPNIFNIKRYKKRRYYIQIGNRQYCFSRK